MFEIFPVVAGILIGILVPRVARTTEQRRGAYALLAVAVAALATVIAREAWFFIIIDLTEVLLAIAVTVTAVDYLSRRRHTAA